MASEICFSHETLLRYSCFIINLSYYGSLYAFPQVLSSLIDSSLSDKGWTSFSGRATKRVWKDFLRASLFSHAWHGVDVFLHCELATGRGGFCGITSLSATSPGSKREAACKIMVSSQLTRGTYLFVTHLGRPYHVAANVGSV